MPELPEVETTRRGIAPFMNGQILRQLIVHEPRMRWPIAADLPVRVNGQVLRRCDRRGKYLLLHFDHGCLLIHLGMSGSLRRASLSEPRRKHDHVEWRFDESRFLLHDPRRFGAVLWHATDQEPVETHPLLVHLRVEPLGEAFTAAHLQRGIRGKQQPIKLALLGGKIVVGVGNIYACESLFRAGIHPLTPAGKLSARRVERLHAAIQEVLQNALDSGGSTLRDYVDASGQPGAYFDIHARVYDRTGQPCHTCQTPIRRIMQAQRATYYCPKCQRH